MNRLITLIALIFALAAVGGVASSNAMAFSSVYAVASVDTSCAEMAAPVAIVQFKACGKKTSGIVMPCMPQIGVLATADLIWPGPAAPHHHRATVSPLPSLTDPVDPRPPMAA